MRVKERILAIRLIEKIKKRNTYSKDIGLEANLIKTENQRKEGFK